jgi:integrase
MASVKRHPRSKFWYGCYSAGRGGKQYQRSTRQTNKKAALEIAHLWERPFQQRLQHDQARRVFASAYHTACGEHLSESSIREFLNGWLARKRIETKPNTWKKYESVVKQFLGFLAEKADGDILFLSSKQVGDFRDEIATRLSSATANLAIKILRVAFNQAFRDGLIQASPAAQVTTISRKGHRSKRRGFSLPELQRLCSIAHDEWQGLTLFGLYTGQRLKDVATLTAHNLDLERNELRLVTSKTGRQQIIPLAAPLRRYIEENLMGADNPDAPLFAKAYSDVKRTGDVRRLSAAFYELLVSAGLARERSRANTGRGRSVKRETSELSFHSLRHTATSLMKNAGISPAIVQDIIGHDSPEMSAHYTQIEDVLNASPSKPCRTSHF